MANNAWVTLRKRYPADQYALMAEVRDKAGHYASCSADFIAVGLWPSRGLAVNGIELKSFRGDWLNELKKPAKAENIFQYCDYFWLLTTDDTIAKMEEIPATWGWLVIKGNRIIQKKDAPKLEPKPVSKHFMAAMLKRASDKTQWVHVDSLEDEINIRVENAKGNSGRTIIELTKELESLRTQIREFNEASGIELRDERWYGPSSTKIGAAVKFIQDGGSERIKKELANLQIEAKSIVSKIESGIKALETNG